MKTRVALSLMLGLGLLVAACGDGGKVPAEAALNAAQSAFDAAKTNAATYVPDQVKAVEDSLAATKATFAKGEYMQAMTEAQSLLPKIAALSEAASAKKADLTARWTGLNTALPNAVEAIQGRLADLSKTRRLPAGMTHESVAGAKTSLDSITATWAEAKIAFSSGNLPGAMAKAQAVKAKVTEVMTTLGMPVPESLT